MDTEQLQKQLQVWDRFMYMALGAAITVVASSPNDYGFVGIVWLLIEILTASSGFFLLWGKRWKSLPLTNRLKTIYGYLAASWLSLFVMLILGAEVGYGLFILGYTIFLGIIYWQIQKKASDSDEMFP